MLRKFCATRPPEYRIGVFYGKDGGAAGACDMSSNAPRARLTKTLAIVPTSAAPIIDSPVTYLDRKLSRQVRYT
jgi:hypothetical protein